MIIATISIVPPSVSAVRASGSGGSTDQTRHSVNVERLLTAYGRASYRAESESPRYSTRTILALHWRTLHGAIRAKDAAIACFGSKHRLAASALVDELAGVSWHRFAFGEAANRTYQHRFKKKVAHARLSLLLRHQIHRITVLAISETTSLPLEPRLLLL
jgi:hypothetical protein